MQIALAFIAIHFTAVWLSSVNKTDNLFGCYVVSGLIWLLAVPVLHNWYGRLFG